MSGPAAAVLPDCSPELFGPAAQDPLTIDGVFNLPPGCTLDFGDRLVLLSGNLTGQDLTLIAGSLRVLQGGTIQGGPGVTTLVLRRGTIHDGSAEVLGVLESRDLHGGGIVIEADGPVILGSDRPQRLPPRLDTSALGSGGSGGFITIEAVGDVQVLASATIISLAGDPGGFGGAISVSSSGGSVVLGGPVQVSGGADSVGAVIGSAAQKLLVSGPIGAPGHCSADGSCSPGGVVRLTAGASLEVAAAIDASGLGVVSPYAGDANGGEVTLDAGGDMVVGNAVHLSGGERSRGGSFTARSGGSFTQSLESIDALGAGETSNGGSISIESGANVDLHGKLLAGGGINGDGGTIQVVADQAVVLLPEGTIDNSANYPTGGIDLVSTSGYIDVTGGLTAAGKGAFGTGAVIGLYANTDINLGQAAPTVAGSGDNGLGGSIRFDAFQEVHLEPGAGLVASGDPGGLVGQGGELDLTGCRVVLDPKSRLEATGVLGGSISLTSAGGGMAVGGAVLATEGGFISLRLPPGLPPDLAGAAIKPDPLIEASYLAGSCVVNPPCDSVSQLSCNAQGSTVSLTWQNALDTSGVKVLRDGVVVASLDASQETFTESGVTGGDHGYTVQGSCLSGDSQPVSCQVKVQSGVPFRRGFCNSDDVFDISDPVFLLKYLFQGGAGPACQKACDANGDGTLDISDGVKQLTVLFLDSSASLPPPYAQCGIAERPDELPCEPSAACPAR